tara:strand:- start:75 stop:248 length:174 start_codon:yes stop_codon:yes gene_type:complete
MSPNWLETTRDHFAEPYATAATKAASSSAGRVVMMKYQQTLQGSSIIVCGYVGVERE